MSTASISHSGPTTPLRPRQSYPVSPDSPRRRQPRQSLVEVVVPRPRREASRDPLDFLDTQDCVVVGETAVPALLPPAPLPPSSIELLPASGSSAASANGRRSARVQKKQEDEAAAAAERKRKRAERKAREAAEKAELQRRIDAGEIEAPEDGKKKRQRTTESRPKPTKTSRCTQSTNSQSTNPPPSQSERGEQIASAFPGSAARAPAPSSTNTSSTSPLRPTSKSVEVASEPQSLALEPRAASPTKRVGKPQTAPVQSSSPAQPTTPGPVPASSVSSSTPAPTTPANRPLQPSRSTPASSDRPSTPGPNGYKWKTGAFLANSSPWLTVQLVTTWQVC